MALWIAPVLMACAAVCWGLSYDARRWWRAENGLPETIRWWFDQRRELRRMQNGEAARSTVFDQLEAEWKLPCAPDPRWRV